MKEERYVCKLSDELVKRAHEELNEPMSDEERHVMIDQLKVAYSEDKFGKLSRSDDRFLIRFLRAKKFNHAKALKCLENYHKVRREYTEVFDRVRNPALIRDYFKRPLMYALEGRAKDGAAVMLYRQGLLDADVNIHDVSAYSVLSIEKLIEEEETQICGMRMIKDMENFNMSIFLRIPMQEMKKMNSMWQDAMPIRVRASHLLHEGAMYDVAMKIFRPLIKQKMLDRLHLHGGDFPSLHLHVPPSILPPYLGGSGMTFEQGGMEWNERLAEDWVHDTEL